MVQVLDSDFGQYLFEQSKLLVEFLVFIGEDLSELLVGLACRFHQQLQVIPGVLRAYLHSCNYDVQLLFLDRHSGGFIQGRRLLVDLNHYLPKAFENSGIHF